MPDKAFTPSLKSKIYAYQKGKCCYCERKMIIFPKEHGQFTSEKKLKIDPKMLECTIEHLVRRAEKGKNHETNYAAACLHCNSNRGNIPWNVYKQIRMEQVEMGLL